MGKGKNNELKYTGDCGNRIKGFDKLREKLYGKDKKDEKQDGKEN